MKLNLGIFMKCLAIDFLFEIQLFKTLFTLDDLRIWSIHYAGLTITKNCKILSYIYVAWKHLQLELYSQIERVGVVYTPPPPNS